MDNSYVIKATVFNAKKGYYNLFESAKVVWLFSRRSLNFADLFVHTLRFIGSHCNEQVFQRIDHNDTVKGKRFESLFYGIIDAMFEKRAAPINQLLWILVIRLYTTDHEIPLWTSFKKNVIFINLFCFWDRRKFTAKSIGKLWYPECAIVRDKVLVFVYIPQ